jgi:NADH:ubiquinone oxidoreductase subunit 5 (subunit L)/multisubunit Na+/H+ antiporter MnhA subunit
MLWPDRGAVMEFYAWTDGVASWTGWLNPRAASRPDWVQPWLAWTVLGGLIAGLITAAYIWKWRITGFAAPKSQVQGDPITTKRLWDWMDLLLVPVAVAVAGIVFTWQQNVQNQQMTDAERSFSNNQTLSAVEDGYIGHIADLILYKSLRRSTADMDVGVVARARTDSVLSRLDSSRKGDVIRFLYRAGLICAPPRSQKYARQCSRRIGWWI